MHTQTHRRVISHARQLHKLAMIALLASLLALLAALPTASANTSSPAPSPSLTLPITVSGLPSSEVEEVLAEVPLSELNLTQLTELLSELPGLEGLPEMALTRTLEDLIGEDATLGQLLEPANLTPMLEAQLEELLSLPELLSLLSGEGLSSTLTSALGSLDPSQLLGTLLSSSAEPEQLLGQLLALAAPAKLEDLLGTTLAGEPFSKTTVAELGGQLGMSTEDISEGLGTTLDGETMALTTPLTNGKTLAAISGPGKLILGLLEGSNSQEGSGQEGGSGGQDEPGGSEDTGDSAGDGDGSGGTHTSGSMTIILNPLPQQAANTASDSDGKMYAKIKILSHRVRGRLATILVQVPAAGKASLGGSHVRSVLREAAKPERVTLQTVLTKAGVASLRRHHRLRVTLRASFKQTGGPRSSATITVTFA